MARITGLGRLRRRSDDLPVTGALPATGALAGAGGDVMARSGNALGLAGDITAPRRRPVSARLQTLGVAVDRVRHRPRADVRQALLVAGAVAMGLGMVAIVLGWYGASHSAYLFQEVPYLISGGLLGLALVVAGGVVVTSGWSLRQIQEARRDTQAMVRSLERIEFALRVAARPEPGTPDTGAGARPAAGGGR